MTCLNQIVAVAPVSAEGKVLLIIKNLGAIMADLADISGERMEVEEEMRRRRITPPPLPAIGVCYYCDTSVPTGHRFCDADYRDGYDYEQKRRK